MDVCLSLLNKHTLLLEHIEGVSDSQVLSPNPQYVLHFPENNNQYRRD